MAERGVDKADDNPFSFKAFMNVKENVPETVKDIFSDDDDDDEDVFGVKGKVEPLMPMPQQPPVPAVPLPLENFDLNDKPKDNPFSFKKFLSSSNPASDTSKQKVTVSHAAPPDIACDIPAFSNNYFDKSELLKSRGKKSSSEIKNITSSKKKALNSNSQLIINPERSNGVSEDAILPTSETSLPLPLFHNDDSENDKTAEDSDKTSPRSLQLPDFLSDGPLLGGKHSALNQPHDRGKSEEDLLCQIHILEVENSRLHNDLTTMKQKYEDKNQRILQLKNDMKQQKKKEAEETAVMEKAVLQVEENLVTTTQRAVQAESTVNKLKQEIKVLQNQMRSLTAENEAYRRGDGGLSDIRERTKYTSEQLKMSADMAEKSLKDLLMGVDKMKLLSQVLSSWEKITEVKPDAAGEATTEEGKSTS